MHHCRWRESPDPGRAGPTVSAWRVYVPLGSGRSSISGDKASKIPLLLPANLEAGGNGIATEGTYFAKEMEIAATEDPEQAHRLGEICGCEAGALGCNWSFAPIIDIDYNWRNPITNVRTFGSDPDTVLAMARAYCQGIRDSGAQMAVCIKHFPGDGRDERDQHLLATVNDLPAPQWEETYGRVYKALIDEGAETVMVGHIYQPAISCVVLLVYTVWEL